MKTNYSTEKPASIWILDDEPAILTSLELLLRNDFSELRTWTEYEKCLSSLQRSTPDVLLMDMNFRTGEFNGQEGLSILQRVNERHPDLPVVVMTAFSDVELAVNSMKYGALDFISKPWSAERMRATLKNAVRLGRSEEELRRWKAGTNPVNEPDENLGMIGTSNELEKVREQIHLVAKTDASVLILGENGTGKELVAQAIHRLSARNKEPFVKIDLGAIHENLFESELFGSIKGAFTGASQDKKGRMVLADNGTLFLDEIGNLSIPLQGKMLSVLQNREVVPVGGVRTEKINIRLLSATNLSSADLFNPNKFRQDLLYRINTVEIHIPPLRFRQNDIAELIRFFLKRFTRKYNKPELKLSASALKAAINYPWPGNIRELEHAVERSVVMHKNGAIESGDIVPTKPQFQSQDQTLNLAETEEILIRKALRKHNGSITKAASELGLTRAALYRRLDKYGL